MLRRNILTAYIVGMFMLSPLFSSSTYAKTADTTNAVIVKSNNQDKKTRVDGEVLAWLMAVDNNEIALGKLAVTKKVDDQVKNYAELMIKAHTDNLHQTQKLSAQMKIQPINTVDVNVLQKNEKNELSALETQTGINFMKAYINTMVKGHQDVLVNIDKYISNSNINSKLVAHLQTTREHVKNHLEMARVIQSAL